MYPQAFSYKATGDTSAILRNDSTVNQDVYPLVKITMNGGNSFSITNEEFGETLTLSELPAQTFTVTIDNENQIITSDDLPDYDFYEHFNFTFLRLKRGVNRLTFDGNASVLILCDFPVNIGG